VLEKLDNDNSSFYKFYIFFEMMANREKGLYKQQSLFYNVFI